MAAVGLKTVNITAQAQIPSGKAVYGAGPFTAIEGML